MDDPETSLVLLKMRKEINNERLGPGTVSLIEGKTLMADLTRIGLKTQTRRFKGSLVKKDLAQHSRMQHERERSPRE